jgi:acyl carrier protein
MSYERFDLSGSLQSVLADHIGVALEEVTPSASLASDLDLDRFDQLELLEVLEGTFSVSIPDEIISKLATVGDVIRCIRTVRTRAAA